MDSFLLTHPSKVPSSFILPIIGSNSFGNNSAASPANAKSPLSRFASVSGESASKFTVTTLVFPIVLACSANPAAGLQPCQLHLLLLR